MIWIYSSFLLLLGSVSVIWVFQRIFWFYLSCKIIGTICLLHSLIIIFVMFIGYIVMFLLHFNYWKYIFFFMDSSSLFKETTLGSLIFIYCLISILLTSLIFITSTYFGFILLFIFGFLCWKLRSFILYYVF